MKHTDKHRGGTLAMEFYLKQSQDLILFLSDSLRYSFFQIIRQHICHEQSIQLRNSENNLDQKYSREPILLS